MKFIIFKSGRFVLFLVLLFVLISNSSFAQVAKHLTSADENFPNFLNNRFSSIGYYQNKQTVIDSYSYLLNKSSKLSYKEADIRDLLNGVVTVAFNHKPAKIGFPPDWNINPFNDENWKFNLNTLRWSIPLLDAYKVTGDTKYIRDFQLVINDFIEKNPPDTKSHTSIWTDHATAIRTRVLLSFWEIYRKSEIFDEVFAKKLLVSIYQHGKFLSDNKNYNLKSNHGIECTFSLLAVSYLFPEFNESENWKEIGFKNCEKYIDWNISDTGFHKEQSPQYHWFVFYKLAEIRKLLAAFDFKSEKLNNAVEKMAINYPLFIMPNGTYPIIGDTPANLAKTDWEAEYKKLFQDDVDQIFKKIKERGKYIFLVDREIGYTFIQPNAIYKNQEDDTYIIFRNNNFPWTHYHEDALSFIFYGLGRDWIVDSGYYNYNNSDPYRKHFISSIAHNVVVMNEKDFDISKIDTIDYGLSNEMPFVTARHTNRNFIHTRKFSQITKHEIRIEDNVKSLSGKSNFSQIFHFAPDLIPVSIADGKVIFVDSSGRRCIVEQEIKNGEWKVISGQKDPYYQGWFSANYNELEKNITLYYTNKDQKDEISFVTTIKIELQQQ